MLFMCVCMCVFMFDPGYYNNHYTTVSMELSTGLFLCGYICILQDMTLLVVVYILLAHGAYLDTRSSFLCLRLHCYHLQIQC